jgi:hypothetical protein
LLWCKKTRRRCGRGEEECQQHNNNKTNFGTEAGMWAEAVEGGIIGTSLLQADRDDLYVVLVVLFKGRGGTYSAQIAEG